MADDKKKYSYNYLISKGLSPIQAAGVVGNLQQESNFDTKVLGFDKTGSVGIAQWLGERKTNLLNFAKNKGKEYSDLDTQLDFIIHELNTTEKNAYKALKQANTVEEATKAFAWKYERPHKDYAHIDKRIKYASNLVGESDTTPKTIVTEEVYTPQISTELPTSQGIVFTEEQAQPKEQEKESVKASQRLNEKSFLEELQNRIGQPIFEAQQQYIQQEYIPITNVEAVQYNPIQNQFQDGGQYQLDREWLNNWYTNRKIENPYIEEAYQMDRKDYIERSKNIPKPTIVNNIGNNVTGRYYGKDNKIELTKDAEDFVYTQEADHHIQHFPSYSRSINQNIIDYNKKPLNMVEGIYKDKYDYFTDPDEVHARIMILRKEAGFKPDEKITKEKLDNFLKKDKEKNSNINDLFNITDPDGVIEMLNNMVSNEKNNTDFYAQDGGQIPISSSGVYDYPNQKVIVPTNGKITMKNVSYPILGRSLQTGEEILMQPEKEYFFKNTQQVLEIPYEKTTKK